MHRKVQAELHTCATYDLSEVILGELWSYPEGDVFENGRVLRERFELGADVPLFELVQKSAVRAPE
jgi:hypothetical protein